MLKFLIISWLLLGTPFTYGHPPIEEIPEFQDLINFIKSNQPRVREWARELMKQRSPEFLRTEGRIDFIDCPLCLIGARLGILLLKLHIPESLIVSAFVLACDFVDFGYEKDICPPLITSFAKPILHIINNRPNLTENDFCGILEPATEVGEQFCGLGINPDLTNWEIVIDQNKPQLENPPALDESIEPIKVLQFTDLHVDVDYAEGSEGHCNYPICCRTDTPPAGPDNTTLSPAGHYGHYECAFAPETLKTMFHHAKVTHPDTKYIFLTGDYVHSGLWLYSPEENGKNIRAVVDTLVENFPNTKTYPVVGNHEPDYVNCFPPEEKWDQFDLSWLYEILAEPFTDYIPTDQMELFKKYGYYWVSPEPGLRLIILNTNLCYVNNFWLVWDTQDPLGQLQWFADTLLEAENEGEKVLVVAHLMPGSGSCWPTWSQKYAQIINRFEGIIQGQFFGHSHKERFSLTFAEPGNDRPTSVSYLAPASVTDGSHPGYKVYDFDGARGQDSTWEVMDHEVWVIDLDRSNELKMPIWRRTYRAKEYFGMKDLRPETHYELVMNLIEDHTLFTKFQRVWWKATDIRLGGHCADGNWGCKVGYLCDLVTADSSDQTHCERIREIIQQKLISI